MGAAGPLLPEKLDYIDRRPAAAAMNEHAVFEHKRGAGCGWSQEHSVGHGLDLDLTAGCEGEAIPKGFWHHDPPRRVDGSLHTKMVFRHGTPSQQGGGRVPGVSSKTLQKHFASSLKRSVAQEIRRARIERAKRELTEGTRSVGEIAKLTGFKSNVSLSVIFRREVGLTPSQYRVQRSLPQRP